MSQASTKPCHRSYQLSRSDASGPEQHESIGPSHEEALSFAHVGPRPSLRTILKPELGASEKRLTEKSPALLFSGRIGEGQGSPRRDAVGAKGGSARQLSSVGLIRHKGRIHIVEG